MKTLQDLELRLEELERKVVVLENPKVKVYIEAEDESQIPFYAHETDAGMDLIANKDIEIPIGKSKIIPTGIKIALPVGFEAQVRARSGVAAKTELIVANSPGTVDAGYRGEVGVILFNNGHDEGTSTYDIKKQLTEPLEQISNRFIERGSKYIIRKGDRIAQIVIARVYKADFEKVTDINAIESDGRGEGGYGSTGVK